MKRKFTEISVDEICNHVIKKLKLNSTRPLPSFFYNPEKSKMLEIEDEFYTVETDLHDLLDKAEEARSYIDDIKNTLDIKIDEIEELLSVISSIRKN